MGDPDIISIEEGWSRLDILNIVLVILLILGIIMMLFIEPRLESTHYVSRTEWGAVSIMIFVVFELVNRIEE